MRHLETAGEGQDVDGKTNRPLGIKAEQNVENKQTQEEKKKTRAGNTGAEWEKLTSEDGFSKTNNGTTDWSLARGWKKEGKYEGKGFDGVKKGGCET